MTAAYCRDCMEAMREMPDEAFDLAVVDPPCGINITGRHRAMGNIPIVGGGGRPFGGCGGPRKTRPYSAQFYHPFDDGSPPDESFFRELRRVSKHLIVFGGNYMADRLGPASCWIVWDKKRRGLDQADCELAWTNLPGQSRIFEYRWNGMLQDNMREKEIRIHPTQKPVALYAWIFARYAKPGYKILDTHLGSGSSRIAAYDAGLDFVGYEIDPVFFAAQEERFSTHAAQGNLFVDGGGMI